MGGGGWGLGGAIRVVRGSPWEREERGALAAAPPPVSHCANEDERGRRDRGAMPCEHV